jgi:hypothetical protein
MRPKPVEDLSKIPEKGRQREREALKTGVEGIRR